MAKFDLDAVLGGNPFDSALRAEGVSGQVADIARSIYQQESGSGRNTRTSNAGARGGMQIIPATFDRMADKGWAIDNPEHNARAGVRYIKTLYEKAGGDPALTAAGYYGGEGAISKAKRGIAVSDPRNPKAPNTLQYGQQVAARLPTQPTAQPKAQRFDLDAVLSQSDQPQAVAKPDTFLGMDKGKLKSVGQGAGDLVGGLARGAGSIGSTILAPYDMAKDAINGKGLSLDSNRARRAGIDGGLQEMGANPDSAMYQTGKIAGEIIGTAGAGGVLANGVRAVSATPRAVAFANALQTGGMRAGSTPGVANMLTRIAGGATTGGTMAGMVDPESSGTGALIGGFLPPALKVAGKVGGAAKRVISGPAVAEPLRKAVESARGAGYVIPPSQAKPTLLNRALEGFSGKITTAQNASARNQPITQGLIAQELGLPAGTPVSLDALKAVRLQAGNAYDAVGSAGTINPTPAYHAALDKITESAKQAATGFPNAKPNPLIAEIESLKTPQFDASSAVAKIKELRAAADAAYAGGNKDLGKALKAGSAALEDAIEAHLTATGAPQTLLDGFRKARQLIAKTYSVEKAMNATSGNVDAVKLGQQLAKGKPLSGGIRDVAAFGQQFPKAAQPIERMGSLPQVSPLDFGALGTMSALTSNPLLMAGVLARPAARGAVLSNVVQNSLAKPQSQNALGNLLMNPNAQQLLYRTAPVAGAQ